MNFFKARAEELTKDRSKIIQSGDTYKSKQVLNDIEFLIKLNLNLSLIKNIDFEFYQKADNTKFLNLVTEGKRNYERSLNEPNYFSNHSSILHNNEVLQ